MAGLFPQGPSPLASALVARAESPRERAWAERMMVNPDDPAQDPVAHDFGARGPTPVNMLASVLAMPQRALDASAQSFGPGGGYIPGNTAGVDAAADISTMLMGGGAVRQFARGGVGELGIFGGKMAKNAPVEDLTKAQALEGAGKSADDIWRETGWGRGADGEWRFEIDDSRSTPRGYGPMTDIVARQGDTAGNVMRHPDLWAAYPDLADTKIEPFVADAARKGTFQPADMLDPDARGILGVNNDLRGNAMGSTMLHELQHGVQGVEGFARGADPKAMPGGNLSHQDLNDAHLLAARMRRTGEAPSQAAKWIEEQLGRKPSLRAMDHGSSGSAVDPMYEYRRTAGETESRNVQKRINMSADERRASPPWATEDVPRDQQIVRRGR